MNESTKTICSRCGKHYSISTCPYCTVAGLDFESLLAAERLATANANNIVAETSSLLDMISGETYTLSTPSCRIGRDTTNDICIASDKSLSRTHFEIRQTDGQYFLEDCKSRNGTFVNNSLVKSPRKLSNGDLISVGMGRYRFIIATPTKTDPEKNENHSQENDNGDTQLEEEQPKNEFQPNSIDNTLALFKSNLESIKTQSDTAPNLPIFIPEIDKLKKERNRLECLLESTKSELKQVSGQINLAQTIASRLLNSQGYELTATAKRVFEVLNWQVDCSASTPNDLSISRSGAVEAIARMIHNQEEPLLPEIEALLHKQVSLTCSNNKQPKCLLLIQVESGLLPGKRLPITNQVLQLLRQKEICLITTAQLLAIYRLICFSGGNKDEARALILETSGILPSFLPCQETVA